MENFPTGLSNRFVPSSSRQMLSWIYWNARHFEHIKENKNVIYRYLLIFIVELPAVWEKYGTLANLSTCCSQICQYASHNVMTFETQKKREAPRSLCWMSSNNKKQCMLFFLITPCCLQSDVVRPQSPIPRGMGREFLAKIPKLGKLLHSSQSSWSVNQPPNLPPPRNKGFIKKDWLIGQRIHPIHPIQIILYFCVYFYYNLL